MPIHDEYAAIKSRAAGQLFSIPGVLVVGVGGRERVGRATGEIVIKVFVARKRAPRDVPPAEMIPAEFEGVGTDVVGPPSVAAGRAAPVAAGAGRGAVGGPRGLPASSSPLDRRVWRQLIGGAMAGSEADEDGVGTIGCFLEHTADPSRVYLLGRQHVLGEALAGPGPTAGDTVLRHPAARTLFATRAIGKYVFGDPNDVVDITVARLEPGTHWYADILDIGPIRDKHSITPEEAATRCFEVRKRGIRTRLTGGTVEAINAEYAFGGFHYRNLTIVRPHPDSGRGPGAPNRFGDHGDSGALVVDRRNRAVGLYFEGFGPAEPAALSGWGKITPIDVVFDYLLNTRRLPVRLATARSARQLRVVPAASSSPPGEEEARPRDRAAPEAVVHGLPGRCGRGAG